MAIIDRRGIVVGSSAPPVGSSDPSAELAIKTPVRAATTANITLSGLQTIDGVALAANDRVLVKNQSSSVENGIYKVSTGNWHRTTDFDGVREAVRGTLVYINEGTLSGGKTSSVTSADPIEPGVSAVTFSAPSSVLTTQLVGFVSGAGAVSPLDSILSAFQKIDGNNALKAPIASPTFTGAPAAPTPAFGDSSTTIPTTEFVQATVQPVTPQGRLTLTTGVSVTTSDVTGTAIYYEPGAFPIYNGSVWGNYSNSELTLALDSTSGHTGYHQSGKNFDLFLIIDSGTLRLGTGPAWSSNTSRGTGAGTTELQQLNAFWTNKNTITIRFGSASGNTVSVAANRATYVGSFRAVADGQATDAAAKRWLFNAYSQALRTLVRNESVGITWTQSASGYRQANNNSANKVEVLLGLSGIGVDLQCIATVSNSTTTARQATLGIGVDSTSVSSSQLGSYIPATSTLPIGGISTYGGSPGLGYHYFAWLELASGTDTLTWYSSSGSSEWQSGLLGKVWM